MKVSEYIAEYLQSLGVTDVFGIPGGVILDLMYALDSTDGIVPHLNYHEQCAGFAACGFAQVEGRLGVAYATKGPGFTNLLTAVADAYYDSIPVLFLTAHGSTSLSDECRTTADQEMDTCAMVEKITKYSKRVDELQEVAEVLRVACKIAVDGRKGPVFLDYSSSLFKTEIPKSKCKNVADDAGVENHELGWLSRMFCNAKRPVVLIGDGINQSNSCEAMNILAEKMGVPVISSRYSHNVIKNDSSYFGYIGSHGIRYANFILSKADLVVSLGNRLNFPSQSLSYKRIAEHSEFLRFDIDGGELKKHPQMAKGVRIDMKSLIPSLISQDLDFGNHQKWMLLCNEIKNELKNEDINEIVISLGKLLRTVSRKSVIVADVGNNEFWVSRACVYAKIQNRTLYSKSFGALGNALAKAIGAYYATKQPVVVIVGDQGLQFNIQELQYISQHCLPIAIILLNNHSSGMIKDREKVSGYDYCLHTTIDSGYGFPNFSEIARAYAMPFQKVTKKSSLANIVSPLFLDLSFETDYVLTPFLPKGREIQDMEPRINTDLYNYLNEM